MLEMRQHQGRYVPMIVCDVCQERISKARPGHALWNLCLETGPVYHVHQRACDRAKAQQIRDAGGLDGWEALDAHLFYVLHNAGLSLRSLQRDTTPMAELLASL